MKGYNISTPSAGYGIFRQAGVASTAFQFNTSAMAPGTPEVVPNISYAAPTITAALTLDASVAGLVFTGTVWGTEEE